MKNVVARLCIFALGGFFLFSCHSSRHMSGEMTSQYLPMQHQHGDLALPYRVYFPKGFDKSKVYPLLLFMHGAGERGEDNLAQLVHGSELIAQKMDELGGIAILPQCPSGDYWVELESSNSNEEGIRDFVIDVNGSGGGALQAVQSLVRKYLAAGYIDRQRVYVTGLSMGGMATFDLLWRMPDTFAAAAPICGAGPESKASAMVDVPMRIYHGAADQVLSVNESLVMYESLVAEGAEVEKYIYEGVGHDSWTQAFAEPDFIEWLFAQSRGREK